MLAEAMQLQAKATEQISNAVGRMVNNEERQTKLLEFIYKCLDNKDS